MVKAEIVFEDEFQKAMLKKSPANEKNSFIHPTTGKFEKVAQQQAFVRRFWGDRYGRLEDPFGQPWSLATHKEDLTPDEIARRQKEFFK